MDERDFLAGQFEANRPHLRAVAYQMLGSLSEADDAVQEPWFRSGLGRIRSVRADQARPRRRAIMGFSGCRRMPAVKHLEH
jgi:DNA-directed RNA polymerase specialized sigma24 family protein